MPGARLKEQSHHKKAFEIWFNLDKRNYEEVGRRVSKSGNTIKDWARNFKWEARAKERDNKAAAKTEERVTDAVAEMNLRHLKYADALQKVGMKTVIRGIHKPADAVRAVETGVKIERLVREQPTEVVEVAVIDRIRSLYRKK
jgi:hypothetical protein